MNKNAIKKFAVWARKELISRVTRRAEQYAITSEGYGDKNAGSVDGRLLSAEELEQRKALIQAIDAKGYEQVMEDVAYTWFNRFSALRFMEVNDYLPSRTRVFTDESGAFKPQILTEAINLELDGLDMEKVYAFKQDYDDDGLFKYLVITQCNVLSAVLPGMFETISDYTELLFPDNLLREGSVIEQMVTTIPEEDWQDQVQIIGWLYQYYNSELKDEVFANLKKKIKIDKNHIPAATQLFTPDWIVRYMVENSLGRLWQEGHPDDTLKANWRYYLEEAEQEQEVQAQLDEIRKEYAALAPEDILCIDPCMGSGHILIYMFDVLLQIYQSYGYSARDAVKCIVEKNLWGLDIDERAAQLAYFSVMMKARQYDRRFFKRDIQPNVFAVAESNDVPQASIDYFAGDDEKLKDAMMSIVTDLNDAKEYGSIIHVTPMDFEAVDARLGELKDDDNFIGTNAYQELLPLVNTAKALSQKYHAVVTNPPYMGSSGMNPKLNKYIKDNFPNAKGDLFSVFIERGNAFAEYNYFNCMVTMQSWMFLSSYEKMRKNILATTTITNLMHMENMVMGIAFGTAVTVFRHKPLLRYKGTYNLIKLEDIQNEAPKSFPVHENWFTQISADNFSKIPGSPIAYWVSQDFISNFSCPTISNYGDARLGMATANNEKFLRIWFEVDHKNIGFNIASREEAISSQKRWFPHNKGGEYRKWYGNFDYVVDWFNDGFEIQNFRDEKTGKVRSHNYNLDYIFKSGITWTFLSSGKFSSRFFDTGFLCDATGCGLYVKQEYRNKIEALLCSKVSELILDVLNPTISYQPGNIASIPVHPNVLMNDKIDQLAEQNKILSKADWDAFETSWDFERHPLLPKTKSDDSIVAMDDHRLEDCFTLWQQECEARFNQLKANEEELNRIFIDIYGLQDELTPEVEDKDVTVRKADLQRDIKSLISYAVGCLLGRYSIDVPGLAYAGGQWNSEKYQTIIPDDDGVLPICDDEYFDDDIVGKFIDFIRMVYGEDTLDQNLKFIADALGGKGTPKEVIRNYFIKDFYKDHCKTYQKRPIYWLFDSGKKNGFKCLIYMHRYQPDTIARIRTDYVHEQQSRYRTTINDLNNRIENAGMRERRKLEKQLKKITEQDEEIRLYEEKIHHLADRMIAIDLDDGVKHNYALFSDVLAKIK